MISANVRGGLGNQLFIVCTALALAARTGQQAVFADAASYGDRPAYWSSVFSGLTRGPLPTLTPLRESGFRYAPLNGTNVMLDGYFQSYLYFIDFDVSRWLVLPEFPSRDATSVHFRRGDYKKWPDLHPLLTVDYYFKALQYVQPTSVLVFCEEQDWEDVEPMVAELQAEFPVPFERADPALSCVEHLALMRSCKSHVIANSTFSWWGAFLAGRDVVVYPARWLGGVDTRDLFPSHWHCII
jgi:hypothetical protein